VIRLRAPYANRIPAASVAGTVVAGDYIVVERIGRRVTASVWTFNQTGGHVRKAAGNLEALALMLQDYGVQSAPWSRPTIGFVGTTAARVYAGRSTLDLLPDSWGRIHV